MEQSFTCYRMDVTDLPPDVEKHRCHPLWHYLCPLLLEEYEWFSLLKSQSTFGHLMQRFWPECFDCFMGWLAHHPEYTAQGSALVIHGVESARRAFETFCDPESSSGKALWERLVFLESLQKTKTESIGQLIKQNYEQLLS